MKRNLILSALLLVIGVLYISGCATYTTRYDYDPQVRFAELTSYDWLTTAGKGQTVDELVLKRIKTALKGQLAAKGYKMDISNPDFLIAIHGGKEKKVDVVDWGYDYRGYDHYRYGYHGYGSRQRRIDVYEYEEGTIILDFVDSTSRELIWRGSVTKVLNADPTPEKREQMINEAVARVLENFPPPGE
jgi:hypothetical protein